MHEDSINPTDESLQSVSIEEELNDDAFDDADEGQFNENFIEDTEELTPNDLFGLDPLDVLTLDELADYLKVSSTAVRRAVKEQNLPGRNLGGEWRFLRDAVANWLRGQEPAAQQQQKARQDYSKQPSTTADDQGSYSAQSSYSSEPQGQSDYGSRPRYPEGRQQYGNRGGNQYGSRGGQYGGGGGGNYGSGGNYGAGGNYGSNSQGQRRSYRAGENQGDASYGSQGSSGYAGYGNGGGAGAGPGQGNRHEGGYSQGGQRFGGGPKRKNRRQVFDNERGKRLDRRRESDSAGEQE